MFLLFGGFNWLTRIFKNQYQLHKTENEANHILYLENETHHLKIYVINNTHYHEVIH
jgi:hypothetical protein